MAVVAMGKLGGREMQPGSDLDLILIYDHPPEVQDSSGGTRSLPAPTWFARLAAQFIAALTAPGAEGRLYEVDMRLRPSGNKGPMATGLAGFERYHAEGAWSWERMALTRARPLAGPPALRRRITAAVRQALALHAGPQVLSDARDMRARMLRDLPPEGPWDVKAMRGGLVEVEFIAQALQCAHAASHPRILATTTREALARLAKARLLPPEDAAALIRADRFWRSIQAMLRLTVGRPRTEALPAAASTALLRVCAPFMTDGTADSAAPVDLGALRGEMQTTAETVRTLFERHLGPLPQPGGGASYRERITP